MAQKVQITLVDDIDGGEATETIPFGIDGVSYEIDVNDKHAVELRSAIEKFAAHARRTGGRKKAAAANGVAKNGTKVNGTKVTLGPSSREIRDWARSNGFPDVPERGRVPGTILEAFEAAH